ncbi:MAG: DUF4160 domain-containing protein [Bacteroidota bacterium]|jgi:hypothetical protein
MPQISNFLGISIRIYYRDHPPPHFHATYSGFHATIDIHRGVLLSGNLPARVVGLISEWCAIHRASLLHNWEKASQLEPLIQIHPLT